MRQRLLVAITAITAITATVVTAAVLAGCGSSDPGLDEMTPTQLLQRTRTAVSAADSVRISGAITENGQHTALDLAYGKGGAAGSMTLDGGRIEVRRVGNRSWFRPSAAFWKAQLGAAAKPVIARTAGRWIVADSGNAGFRSLVELGHRTFVTDQLLNPSGSVKRSGTRTVAGVRCAVLESQDGLLYVSLKDARPIRITGKDKDTVGQADFDYATVAPPAVPPASQVVDLAAK